MLALPTGSGSKTSEAALINYKNIFLKNDSSEYIRVFIVIRFFLGGGGGYTYLRGGEDILI
jgi:hypothetical protein